jgi:periplasmic divalent cation tolerance protein
MSITTETTACLVLVTCPNLPEAQKIAEHIVTKKLAACVNILGEQSPLQSLYWWEGQVQQAQEILLLIKTRLDCLPLLEQEIRTIHSYQIFEFIALPIQAGSRDYLSWVAQESSTT